MACNQEKLDRHAYMYDTKKVAPNPYFCNNGATFTKYERTASSKINTITRSESVLLRLFSKAQLEISKRKRKKIILEA